MTSVYHSRVLGPHSKCLKKGIKPGARAKSKNGSVEKNIPSSREFKSPTLHEPGDLITHHNEVCVFLGTICKNKGTNFGTKIDILMSSEGLWRIEYVHWDTQSEIRYRVISRFKDSLEE